MAWYGPRGNCGCCKCQCGCPIITCDCFGDELNRKYSGLNLRIANFPATIYTSKRADGAALGSKVVYHQFIYGLDQVNSFFSEYLQEPCTSSGEFSFTAEFRAYQVPQLPDPAILNCSFNESNLTAGGTLDMRLVYFGSAQQLQLNWLWALVCDNSAGVPVNQIAAAQPAQLLGQWDFCNATEESPIKYIETLERLSEFGDQEFWYGGGLNLPGTELGVCGDDLPITTIQTHYWPTIAQGDCVEITGWRYVVSDIPEFVDVRAFGTTVYRVQGLDAYNGTYDVARDEDLDCAAGLQQFQLNLTAEQYDITTGTPCLETPIPGGTKDVLATLTIPPRQSNKAILNLVIDGVGTFSYTLSEDWDSYACGPQTETLTESDPCLTHTGDWLSIESSALF